MKANIAIFDLDGTLLNTLDDLANAMNAALAAFSLPQRTTQEVCSYVGNGVRKLVERAVPQGTDKALVDKVFSYFMDYYEAHNAERTAPYAGVCDILHALRERGIKTAVVSNKADCIVQPLCVHYFDGLFDAVVGARENVRRKPAPDAVFAVLETFHVKPHQAVFIGDSEVDVATAHNAGVNGIAVSWGFRSKETLLAAGATHIVDTPEELLAALL